MSPGPPPSARPPRWPTTADWQAAVQNPHISFADAFLRGARPAVDRLQMPVVSSGNFACVFKLVNGGQSKAVRCFNRYIPDSQSRYEAVDRCLDRVNLPAIVQFDYDPTGIRVNGSLYPMVVMEWLNGNALDVHLEQRVSKPDVVAYLAEQWLGLMAQLEAAKVAHGDLQHGNVLVCAGQLRLVDLDGMFVPELRGRQAVELGHRAYQHPRRDIGTFDERIDRFSALVIYASLKALERDPSLWRFHDENLIFKKEDYLQPRASAAFRACRALGGEVAGLVDALAEACERDPLSSPELSSLATAKVSKLPTWMRSVPQGVITGEARTREAPSTATPSRTPSPAPAVPRLPAAQAPSFRAVPVAPAPTPQRPPLGQRLAARGKRFIESFFMVFFMSWWLLLGGLVFGGWVGLLGTLAFVGVIALIYGVVKALSKPNAPPAPSSAPLSPPSRPSVPSYPSAGGPFKTPQYPPSSWPSSRPASHPRPTSRTTSGPVVASSIRSIYHDATCEWAGKISQRNRIRFASAAAAEAAGYRPCLVCKP